MMCVKDQKTVNNFLSRYVVICVLLTIVPSIFAVSRDNVLKEDENGFISPRHIHKRSTSKLDIKRSGIKDRPVRSPQGADPQGAIQDGMQIPQLGNNRQFDIAPTMTTDQHSVNPQNPEAPEQTPQNAEQGPQFPAPHQNSEHQQYPGNHQYPDPASSQYPGQGHPHPEPEHTAIHLEGAEGPESLAEQRDDELEEMLDMLHLRGYTHTVLPDNMSMYPDIMNYTEPAEEQEEAEGGEQEEQEGGEEYEADEHPMMTLLPNGTSLEEMDEFEADEGLQPSTERLPPHKVHDMHQMLSSEYDPFYNYGYQYRPKEGKPYEKIQPTQVVLASTKMSPMNAEKKPTVQGGNGTAGSPAQMVDVKKITHKKLADFGGLSASATFGIVLGTVVGFWLVMGPLICLLMKVREHHKEKEKRFLIGPRSQSDKKSDRGIMEAMIMTELGKLPFRKKGFKEFPKPSRAQERMSLTDDKDETYHDAIDTPVLLP